MHSHAKPCSGAGKCFIWGGTCACTQQPDDRRWATTVVEDRGIEDYDRGVGRLKSCHWAGNHDRRLADAACQAECGACVADAACQTEGTAPADSNCGQVIASAENDRDSTGVVIWACSSTSADDQGRKDERCVKGQRKGKGRESQALPYRSSAEAGAKPESEGAQQVGRGRGASHGGRKSTEQLNAEGKTRKPSSYARWQQSSSRFRFAYQAINQ